jgi:PAS domain S-box-containing protein
MHTAFAFLICGLALLIWAWQAARRDHFNFFRWLPVTASVTVMAMIAIISAASISQLKSSMDWRKHTVKVILAAHTFEDNLLDLQRAMRAYTMTGDANTLATFENAGKLEPQQFDELDQLTLDNSSQQQRLKKLGDATRKLLDYDNRMIQIYKHQGADAVLKADVAGTEGRTAFGDTRDALKNFSEEEEKLLDQRDAVEQSNYRRAEQLLVAGIILAAALILFANMIASHELDFRHRAEAKLSRALTLQKAIFNSADYGIVTTNPEGIVQTFNPAAEKMLGYPAKEVIGKATPMLWRDAQEVAERAQKLSVRLGMPVRPSFEAIAKKVQFDEIDEGEWTYIRKNGTRFIASLVVTALSNETGNFTGFIGIFRDISARKNIEAEREKLIFELKEAIAQVKTLSGLIPICGWCKNVRNDKGYWSSVEQYVRARTDATFTHGICPDCQEKFKSDIARANGGKLVT